MSDRQDPRLKRLLEEKLKRHRREASIDFEKLCYNGQREFVSDASKRILACCSRQAGKSYGIALKFCKTGFEFDKSTMLYMAMARGQGREILWPAMEDLNDKLDLGLKFNKNSGDILFPNKSKVLMRGLGSHREADKNRGPGYRAICIDEAQGYPSELLRYTIRQVVEPAQLRYAPGEYWFALTGTPNASCSGGFYEAWANVDDKGKKTSAWSTHHWTFLDNESVADPEAFMQGLFDDYGWDLTTPSFQREYQGKWVRDVEGTAFRIRDDVNLIYEFPHEAATDWRYVLGVDLGIMDPSAFVVYAYSRQLGLAIIVESLEEETDSPSESAKHVLRLCDKYDISEVVADTGGQGKAHVGEWARTYGLAATPAEKHNKAGRIGLMNSDLQSGKLLILAPNNRQLITELQMIQVDLDAQARGRFLWARGYKDHLADAAQYGFGACHHHHTNFRRLRTETVEERNKKVEERMEEAALRRARSRREVGWKQYRKRYYSGKEL